MEGCKEHHDHAHHDHHSHDHNKEKVIEEIKKLPLKERPQLIALSHIQDQKQVLDKELEKKIEQLQKEYDQKAAPIYEEYQKIVLGRAITDEEQEHGKQFFHEDELEEMKTQGQNSEAFEEFWGKAIQNCQAIGDLEVFGEKDEELLKLITKIELEQSKESQNFTLTFHFKENEYFTNTSLKKTFIFGEDEEDEEFPKKSEGTAIEWKEGKNVTVKTIKKKQKNKKTGATRTVNKEVEAQSFFNFFKSQEAEDDGDDSDKEQVEVAMEKDFELGRTIMDEVIPYCLEYYLGINPETSDFEDVDDEEGDDGDDDDEDDEDEGKKKKAKGKKAKGGKGDKPPCEQQ